MRVETGADEQRRLDESLFHASHVMVQKGYGSRVTDEVTRARERGIPYSISGVEVAALRLLWCQYPARDLAELGRVYPPVQADGNMGEEEEERELTVTS